MSDARLHPGSRAAFSRVAGRAARVVAALGLLTAAAHAGTYGIGRPATPQEIAGWNIDVSPGNGGLPAGHGSVAEGEKLFATRCAACHGAHGEGKPMDPLVGGVGSLHDKKPKRTPGSYWPYATTLFDYIRRAMPFDAPQSLKADEVYAVTAYLLSLNKIVPPDTVLDQSSLLTVKMPNRDGFVSSWRGR